jgi:hypothetical protein
MREHIGLPEISNVWLRMCKMRDERAALQAYRGIEAGRSVMSEQYIHDDVCEAVQTMDERNYRFP